MWENTHTHTHTPPPSSELGSECFLIEPDTIPKCYINIDLSPLIWIYKKLDTYSLSSLKEDGHYYEHVLSCDTDLLQEMRENVAI